MSLNRCEQRIYDYLQANPEERAFWQHKIRAEAIDSTAAIARLESDLWHYYEERSAVAAPFKEAVRHEGLHRISMRNLVELLVRLWTEPKQKKKSVP